MAITDEDYYRTLCAEVQRHLQDAETSKLAHFYAAGKYETWNKYLLGLPSLICGLILSWLVSQEKQSSTVTSDILDISLHYFKILLGLTVSVLGGLTTFLNLNNTASQHRKSAQRYHELWRRCKNWETDFPDEMQKVDAKKLVLKYREEIISINQESLQIPHWAWKGVKPQIDEGSTSYLNE